MLSTGHLNINKLLIDYTVSDLFKKNSIKRESFRLKTDIFCVLIRFKCL